MSSPGRGFLEPEKDDELEATASGNEALGQTASRESGSPGRYTSKFAASLSATRVLTAHITQQEIMRQVGRDEELSGDTNSLKGSSSQLNLDGAVKTGEEQVQQAVARERNMEGIRQTVGVFTKDMKKAGISRRQLLRAVMEDERQCKTCLTLPMSIMFPAVFILFFQNHYNTAHMFLNESAIRAAVTQSPYEAMRAEEAYDWMQGTMFPWLWTLPNVPGATNTKSDAMTFKLLGGVLISTAKGSPLVPCEEAVGNDTVLCAPFGEAVKADDLALKGWAVDGGRRLSTAGRVAATVRSWAFGPAVQETTRLFLPAEENNAEKWEHILLKKAKKHTTRIENSRPVQDRKAHKIAQARAGLPLPRRNLAGRLLTREQDVARKRRLKELMAGFLDRPVPTSGVIYKKAIPMSTSLADVLTTIETMKNIVDKRTLFISLEFFVKNDNYGFLTKAEVNFMFSRAGGFYTEIQMLTHTMKLGMVAMGLLVLFIIGLLRLTFVQILTAVISTKRGAFCSNVLKVTNLIDCVIIATGWMVVILVVVEILGMKSFNGLWDDYSDEVAKADRSTLEEVYTKWTYKFFEDMAGVNSISEDLITLTSVYTVLLLSRFLIATMGHPRLAIIMKPLIQGASDMVHLLVIFMLILIAYVLTGHILMGRRMEELATFKAAFSYCLQIVFQRQYDYDRITEENMVAAAFWIVSLVLLLVLVMVNLMLAMIFNHYAAVRDQVGQDETVFQFFRRLLLQLRLQSVWISNTDLLVMLAQIPINENPTVATVKRMFPEISDAQLTVIFDHACRRATQTMFTDTKNVMPEYFAGLLLMLRDVRKGIFSMQEFSMEMPEEPMTKNQIQERRSLKLIPLAEQDFLAKQEAPTAPPQPIDEEEEGTVPVVKPDWVQNGMLITLNRQRESMATLIGQMETMSERMAARGIQGGGFPITSPPKPNFTRVFMFEEEGTDVSKGYVQVVDCSKGVNYPTDR